MCYNDVYRKFCHLCSFLELRSALLSTRYLNPPPRDLAIVLCQINGNFFSPFFSSYSPLLCVSKLPRFLETSITTLAARAQCKKMMSRGKINFLRSFQFLFHYLHCSLLRFMFLREL